MITAAQTRVMTELLAVEGGGMMPLRAVAGGNGVYAALQSQKLIEVDPKNGRFRLTAAGRAHVNAAQAQDGARGGSVGACSLRAVRG